MVNGRGVLLFHKEKESVLSSIWLIFCKHNVCNLGYSHTWHSVKLQTDENTLDSKIKLSSKELWCLTTLYGLINGLCVLNLRENWVHGSCYEIVTKLNQTVCLVLSYAHRTDKTMEFHNFQSKDIKDNFIPLTRESSDRSMALT